jgi:hypothetical protein
MRVLFGRLPRRAPDRDKNTSHQSVGVFACHYAVFQRNGRIRFPLSAQGSVPLAIEDPSLTIL